MHHRTHTTHSSRGWWLIVALAAYAWGCGGTSVEPSTPEPAATTQTLSEDKIIAKAMSAAPKFVSEKATIYKSFGDRTVLREGTNGFFCFPEFNAPNPMCLEQEWLDVIEALVAKRTPAPTSKVAVLYALKGLFPGTNEDPHASPEEQAKHVQTDGGPHIAIRVPEQMLEGITTSPSEGRPWVMYKGTPYVHLMVPTPAPGMASSETASTDEIITKAMSAAPKFVSEKATIYKSFGDRTVLREGTNGFFCFPEFNAPNPMCVEQEWVDVIEALVAKRTPAPTSKVAVLYALRGLFPGTNEDPHASPEEQAKHVQTDGGPHIAFLVPDTKILEGITTSPSEGRPWVMYKGTPYVHLMVPTPRL